MAQKTITVCDGCGKEINNASERYHLSFSSDRFWNAVEMDYLQENLEFCKVCAINIKNTLHKILEKSEGN